MCYCPETDDSPESIKAEIIQQHKPECLTTKIFRKSKSLIHPFITKQFEAKSQNKVLSVEPSEIEFSFTKVNQTCHGRLKFSNISGKALRIYFLPLQSKYFHMEPNDKSCILPGLPLFLNVQFTSQELRHYCDWLKIVCIPGDSNLMISLKAAPASPYDNIPKKINLGTVLLGETVTTKFTIAPSLGVDIHFLIYLPEPSKDFCVEPTSGSVKQNEPPMNVAVNFRPTEYTTIHFPIQLYIPQSSRSPYTITVYANCKPGLARDRLMQQAQKAALKKPVPCKEPRKMPVLKKALPKPEGEDPKETLRKLQTVHGVVKFLLAKEPKRHSSQEQLGPFGRYLSDEQEIYRAKEKEFQREMAKFRSENEATLLHHRDKFGETLTEEMREHVMSERDAQWEQLQDMVLSETPSYHPKRVIRNYDCIPDMSFSDTPNDTWFVRFLILCRFIQAARRVILQRRLTTRLQKIKNAREFIVAEMEKQREEEETERRNKALLLEQANDDITSTDKKEKERRKGKDKDKTKEKGKGKKKKH